MTTDAETYHSTVMATVTDYDNRAVAMQSHDDMTYQVWYWSVNLSQDILMKTTTQNTVVLDDLIPGEIYNIWLMGVRLNQSQDLVTFQHRTSVIYHF